MATRKELIELLQIGDRAVAQLRKEADSIKASAEFTKIHERFMNAISDIKADRDPKR